MCRILNIWIVNNIQRRNIFNKVLIDIKMLNARWAFNASAWKPTQEEILLASTCIQPEEKQRISKFVFQDDAKSSLIGRLMMRKFVHLSTSIPYEEITLGRDGHGKPYLMGVGDTVSSFNVSHQGDYVVLAGNARRNIAIDIMKVEPVVNKDIQEFFRLMNKQFSPREWDTIHSFSTEGEQVACFYRLWCLKESYVKNTGFGITVPLQDISFDVKTLKLEVGEFVTDTTLYERGVLKHDWVFEETLLDDKHAVAVSVEAGTKDDVSVTPYKYLSFEEIIKEAKPKLESDSRFTIDFMKKKFKKSVLMMS